MTSMRPDGTVTVTTADLTTGDHLLRLGGVGYAQLRDPDAAPVIVAEVRPPLEDNDPDDAIVEILTSAGTMYARATAPALVTRADTVTARTILLISRRRSLHAHLLGFGIPVVRRTPVDPGKTVAAVTPVEWASAPLIVVDGYLSRSTINAMWSRGDLIDRDQIVMVGTDPDDVRLYGRQEAAHARLCALLPYDKASLASLFSAAVQEGTDRAPFPGILTPHSPPTGR